ncbi:MAG: hypothetical protein BWY79_00856 [Actinobacteria bacterium ADurb.Bin444]|nr:MAG: hypothetical protein BWY79_00856 [Actinobacteria bacterium ADurb.Bin444]
MNSEINVAPLVARFFMRFVAVVSSPGPYSAQSATSCTPAMARPTRPMALDKVLPCLTTARAGAFLAMTQAVSPTAPRRV